MITPVLTILVISWNAYGETHQMSAVMSDPTTCGEMMVKSHVEFIKIHPDSMHQCLLTLVPSELDPPKLRP